jgi:hypothetical protein
MSIGWNALLSLISTFFDFTFLPGKFEHRVTPYDGNRACERDMCG